MNRDLLWLACAWLPLWIIALVLRQRIRPGRLLMGAGLVGFVGGMCAVELRRYGLLASLPDAISLPVFSLHVDEVLRFAFWGATGALAGEVVLDIVERPATEPSSKK